MGGNGGDAGFGEGVEFEHLDQLGDVNVLKCPGFCS